MLTPEHYSAFYLVHEERVKECLREKAIPASSQLAGQANGEVGDKIAELYNA